MNSFRLIGGVRAIVVLHISDLRDSEGCMSLVVLAPVLVQRIAL